MSRAFGCVVALALVGCAGVDELDPEEVAADLDIPVEMAEVMPYAMTIYYGDRDNWNVDTVVKVVDDPINVGSRGLTYRTGLVAQFERSLDQLSINLRESAAGEEAVFRMEGATDAEPRSGGTCEEDDGVTTCRIAFPFKEGAKYRLRIWTLENRWWGAWVIDEDGSEHMIGKMRAPEGAGRPDGYYKIITYFKGDIACDDLPRAASQFFGISSNNGRTLAERGEQLTGLGCEAGSTAGDLLSMSTTHILGD